MSRFQMIVLAATVVDIVVCAAALGFRLRRRSDDSPTRFGMSDAFVVIAAGSVAFVMKLPLLVIARVGVFGIMHLIYADLAIAAPVLAMLTLILTRKHRPRICVSPAVNLVAVLSLIAPVVAYYATFVEPYRLEERQTNVAFEVAPPQSGTNEADEATEVHSGADTSHSITIVVLSDMQFARVTAYERDVIQRAMAHKPDIILLPGDILQGNESNFQREEAATRELLSGLSAPGGVFLVQGDVDRPFGIKRLIAGTEIQFVFDQVVRTNVRGVEFAIGGIQLAYNSPGALRTIDALESAANTDVRLLLAHRPDVVLGLEADSTVDLVVAGHTHGGQVQIPGIGPLITATRVPRSVAAGGLHRVDGNRIYISRGVGMERGQAPPLRLFCRPELSILHCDFK